MSDKPISPLRQRMIDDMTVRRVKEKVQKDLYFILDHCLAHARSADRWDNHVRVARRGNEGPLGLEFDA